MISFTLSGICVYLHLCVFLYFIGIHVYSFSGFSLKLPSHILMYRIQPRLITRWGSPCDLQFKFRYLQFKIAKVCFFSLKTLGKEGWWKCWVWISEVVCCCFLSLLQGFFSWALWFSSSSFLKHQHLCTLLAPYSCTCCYLSGLRSVLNQPTIYLIFLSLVYKESFT